ncbi:MAG TPA: ABC transporter permease [Gemmatimonadaceae bacterium]|nr:ABC transporter permease [Gemmatimonadaceae bacterium]
MDSFVQDVRFALRSLWKSRLTSALAVLCLALGIGANTAIFSVVRAVLLESLPFRDPEHLVMVWETYVRPEGTRATGSVAPANYFEWQKQTRIFTDLAGYMPISRDLGDISEPERLRGLRATTNLFDVLGARPLLGRTLLASDQPPAGAPVVVISERLWRRRFAADASLVGSAITLQGSKVTVVGIMPATFDFPVAAVPNDFWVPFDWRSVGDPTNRGNHSLSVVGRLAAGVDSARAMADLAVVARRLALEFPDAQRTRGIQVMGLGGWVVQQVRPALLVLLGAVGVVLVIVCANVANLLLTRAAGRRREVAIRTALGAARGRLVRQLLTESAVLAAAGGVLGILVAQATLVGLRGMAATIVPHAESIYMHSGVLLFAIVVSLATGLVVGIVPALRASQVDLREDLTEAAGRTSASGRRRRALNALIVTEVALSLVLLIAAGLVIRSFVALLDTDPGFAPQRLLTFRVAAPPIQPGADSERFSRFYYPVLQGARAIPGVQAAAFTSILPISGGATDRYFNIDNRPQEKDLSRMPDAEIRHVSGDYFRTMRIPLVAGREFDDHDVLGSEHVVIINDELARRYFPEGSPLGRTLTTGEDEGGRIVGVVRSVRQMSLDQGPRAEFYIPVSQARYSTQEMTFVIRATGRPEDLTRSMRAIVRGVAPQPIYQLATMEDVIAQSLTTRRLVLVLLLAFAGLALLLSAAGVYGVMSYGVSQRTREIGIRMALGARAADVLGMILSGALGVIVVGIGVGLAVAALATRALGSILYGVGALDPATFVTVPAIIALVGLVAGAVPAVRAARVDPMESMRAE